MARPRRPWLALSVLVLLASFVSGGVASAGEPPAGPAHVARYITNPYMPLAPGNTFIYRGESEGEEVLDVVTVLNRKKVILGIPCVVVQDTVYVGGELAEKTYDWYVQDSEGNVWYMGEDSAAYENGVVVSREGSWQAGVDGARAGIIMETNPQVGDVYQQEYYEGEAEDMAQVLSLDESVSVAYGDFDGLLLTKEWSPLEPDVVEHKYYAAGIGLVYSEAVAGEQESLELVAVRKPHRNFWR